MKDEIAKNGYQAKYTDEELLAQARKGDIANERYHVRFMKKSYLEHRDHKHVPMSGYMGTQFIGEDASSKGVKHWPTTFDQIEDADSDPKLIAQKLGLGNDYDPDADYVMVIVDTEVTKPITHSMSVSATFENVSDFSNKELGGKFPNEFTDAVMNEEFQKNYAQQSLAAYKAGFLESANSKNVKKFEKYLASTNLSDDDKKLLLQRMEMQRVVGNNQEYVGNGVTQNSIEGSDNEYGVVETLNLERKEVSFKDFPENALNILYL